MTPDKHEFARYELHVSVPCLESHGRFGDFAGLEKAVLRWLTPKERRDRVQDALLEFDAGKAVDGRVENTYQGMTVTAWLE